MRVTDRVAEIDRAQQLWDSGDSRESREGPVRDWLAGLTVDTRARQYELDWAAESVRLYVSWLSGEMEPRAVARHTDTGEIEDLPEELAEWLWGELDWHLGSAESYYLLTQQTLYRVKAESAEDALGRLHSETVLLDQTHTVEEEL